jgi:hypothetical protein
MSSATVSIAIACLLASGAVRPGVGVPFQTAAAQQTSEPNASPATVPPAAKPCPTVPPSTSATPSDGKPPAKSKKHRRPQPAVTDQAAGPTKKVVRNGSTSDPTVDISPGVSEQQASKQIETTNQLLAKTNENLKIVESRQLNAGQQDTVKQIHSYMDQSKAAAEGGDAQRAYTLANKARMLSGDLVKH